MHGTHLLTLGLLALLSPVVRADLILSIDNIQVATDATSLRVGVRASGPDRLNNVTLAFALGDGGADFGGVERAQITGFSLDQTIWDTDLAIGSVATTTLASASLAVPVPTAATLLNLAGSSLSSSVDANGIVAFFDIDLGSRPDRTTPIKLDANFMQFTAVQGPNQTPVTLISQFGSITFVPEPGGIGILFATASCTLARRRRTGKPDNSVRR